MAFLTSVFVLVFGFIPTESVRDKGMLSSAAYVGFLLVGVVGFVLLPLYLYRRVEKKGRVAE